MHQAERARRRLTIATRTRLLDNLNIVAERTSRRTTTTPRSSASDQSLPRKGGSQIFSPRPRP